LRPIFPSKDDAKLLTFSPRGFHLHPRAHAVSKSQGPTIHRNANHDRRENREEILRIAARHGARNVRLFGSVARGEDWSDTDVDLLFDMEGTRSLSISSDLERELEELLQRKVDVLTDESIPPAISRTDHS